MNLPNEAASCPSTHSRVRQVRPYLILIGAVLLVGWGQAQGTITFGNSASTLIKFSTSRGGPPELDGQPVPTGTAGPYPDFRVALCWFNGGAFEQVGSSASIAPIAGRFSGGTRVVTGLAPGSSGTFKVAAWSHGSTFPTYEAALAAVYSGFPGLAFDESAQFSNGTGGAGSPPGPAVPLSGFTGMIVRIVPEPSTLTLSVLGAALLLVRGRRRGGA